MILISAGTLLPPMIFIKSPITIVFALTSFSYPSLITIALGGIKFLNPAISLADFPCWKKENRPVIMTTIISTIPK